MKCAMRIVRPRSRRSLLLACLTCVACGSERAGDLAGGWVGTVAQEDRATVIRTKSGSVWGAPATLDGLLTLGEEGTGPPLADVRSVAESHGRIFVLDVQEAVLQIYDTAGVHLETVGRHGEGPGEFQRPIDLALNGAGRRLYVRDGLLRRISVFGLDGSLHTTWATPTVPGLLRPMVLLGGEHLYLPITLNPVDPPGAWRYGMAAFGPEGPSGDTIRPPEMACALRELTFAGTTRGSISTPVPFGPQEVWALTGSGWMVAGCSDRYRITIHLPDGSRKVLERENWDPIPVQPLEAEWHRGMITARIRLDDPTWVWRGPDVPAVKPAFEGFFTDPQERLWILRAGPGRELEGGIQSPEDPMDFFRRPRWEETHVLEAFDHEGRFLGSLDLPPGVRFRPLPWIDGDRMLALVEAPSGEPTVRVFRLLIPS